MCSAVHDLCIICIIRIRHISYIYCTCLQVGSRVRYTKVPDGERAKAQDVVKP